MTVLTLALINAELKRRGITNKDIADRLCKSQGTIGNWLSKGNITIKQLDELMVAYGIQIERIVFK